MPSTTLVNYSNLALYSAMAVFTVAMLFFAFHLAALGPVTAKRGRVGGARRAGSARELAAATSARSVEVYPSARGLGYTSTQEDEGGAEDLMPSRRARKLAGMALSVSWLGTFLIVASVVLRGLAVMRPPWGNMFEFACAGAAALALAYCLLARRNHWEWLGLFVIGPVLLTLGLALFAFYTEAAELVPALKSVWLVIHVVVAVLAVGIFTIAFSVGVVYLVKKHREEHPPARKNFMETLPAAQRLERTAYGLNMVGFILWTFTLIAGAIWAQKAWSAYWTWDPKEVWTFVIWVVFAAYMHARATAGWEPKKAIVLALVGYVCVLLNFTLVNLVFTGMHSYSGLK
jgi:cytochrome c-type biogenesis protein CcsB